MSSGAASAESASQILMFTATLPRSLSTVRVKRQNGDRSAVSSTSADVCAAAVPMRTSA